MIGLPWLSLIISNRFTNCFDDLRKPVLFYPAGTFVVFANIFYGFNTDFFQDVNINIGKFFYIDAGLAHFKFTKAR